MVKYFTNNLYINCLEEPAFKFVKLRILTGYSSGEFLKIFVERFPKLKLELYIGMAKQGISKIDHAKFMQLTKLNENVNVYYQIESPMTHIKLYQWYSENKPEVSYVGSANFSENAFTLQNELLMQTEESFDALLNEYEKKMLLCTAEKIKDLIPINDEVIERIITDGEKIEETIQVVATTEKKFMKNNNLLELKRWVIEEKLEKLSIDLVDNNYISLNIWLQKQQNSEQSFLVNPSPKKEKQNFFPKNKNFKVITFDNIEFSCYTSGNFGKNILVAPNQEIDFYKYFTGKMGINEIRELKLNDFLNYGTIKVMFYKKNETEYYMDFSPK